MDSFLTAILKNPKIPKWMRYLLLTFLVGIIAYIGVMICLNSPMKTGKMFGAVLTLTILILGKYAALTIYRN